jgi:hypothetical protein
VRPQSEWDEAQTPAKGCVVVNASWKHWPCLFPQHGPGKKHLRTIELVPWQREIAGKEPGRLLRGLIHSDCLSRAAPISPAWISSLARKREICALLE